MHDLPAEHAADRTSADVSHATVTEPYMTYRERQKKKARPREAGSTKFKKRRVAGPLQSEFLQSLLDLLRTEDAGQTPNKQDIIAMLHFRIEQARLNEQSEDLSELTESSTSPIGVLRADSSEAMEDVVSDSDATRSVQLRGSTFSPSSQDNPSDEDVILYSVGELVPSTPEASTSEGDGTSDVPDPELQHASSDTPSRSSGEVVMDVNDAQVRSCDTHLQLMGSTCCRGLHLMALEITA